MPRFTRSCCGSAVIRSPPRNTSPAVGGSAPVSRLMSVVLPAPFGPISACRAPCGNDSATSLAALNAPKCFDRPAVESAGVTAALPAGDHAAAASAPRMPPRANITTVTSSRPSQNCQYTGLRLGQVVVRDHEDRGADEPAVEAPGAAEHQHDHQVGRAREAEHVEADELRGLRKQAAGHTGHRGADRVDRDQATRHRRADRRHAPHVLAHAAQRQSEGRAHDAAGRDEQHEQHGEAVGVAGAAGQVEREHAEELPHRHAGEAVGAAGDRRNLVRHLEQHQADAQASPSAAPDRSRARPGTRSRNRRSRRPRRRRPGR